MSLELCILGSGSSGNSTVVRAASGNFLIDAGFGPRTTSQRMASTHTHCVRSRGGLSLDVPDLSAILLTHLDHDHFNPNWFNTLIKNNICIYCTRSRVRDILESPEARDAEAKRIAKHWSPTPLKELVIGFGEDPFEPIPGVQVEAISFAHDAEGSHGFLLTSHGYKVGFATDLGHVPDELVDRFCGVDLLAIESNYDVKMERESDRPWFLKNRIMGGHGHLSNDQALAAVQSILDRTEERCGPGNLPRHIVLLHRSRQCNRPELLERVFKQDRRIAQVLTLAHQEKRTPWLSTRARAAVVRQLALWG